MLISPAYAELQRNLHATQDYGVGSHANECAVIVSELGVETKIETVLDYGSGSHSHMAKLLTQYRVADYDPAIPGRDAEPESADVVVCADVLEHIEPDCLGDVLHHIRRLSKKFTVLVIATVAAQKTLADGRNAHLIIENPSWWAAQIGVGFDIFHMDARHGRMLAICRPKPFAIGKINVVAAVENDERNANVRVNCAREPSRLDIDIKPHGRRAVLVCSGPSLHKTWPVIAMAQAEGADVFSVSISHKFLMDRGIIPDAHMDCDPREHKVRQFGEPCAAVSYWLASCVHPSYLDKVAGCDVQLWHSYNGEGSIPVVREIDPTEQMVIGGGSVGLRAMSVLYLRGYREIDIHGMDCSYAEDGTDHCGVHLGKKLDIIPTICGDRVFKSTAVNIAYCNYFFKSQRMLKGATFNLYGDGLLAERVKQGMKPDAVEGNTDVE